MDRNGRSWSDQCFWRGSPNRRLMVCPVGMGSLGSICQKDRLQAQSTCARLFSLVPGFSQSNTTYSIPDPSNSVHPIRPQSLDRGWNLWHLTNATQCTWLRRTGVQASVFARLKPQAPPLSKVWKLSTLGHEWFWASRHSHGHSHNTHNTSSLSLRLPQPQLVTQKVT